ncbi:MAG TPA: FAD-binding oxidoreductase, partial [Bacteroidales bacterium]|nr:FAD-binding oxidoreductase [Bacteroidales bacterium]
MDNILTGLNELAKDLEGDLRYDEMTTTIYSTDASVYKEKPTAVIWPRNKSDLKKIILFAGKNRQSIIMRAGGTSLAGQVVGKGIVVDISRYMNHILEINKEGMWVRVEPGVVLDELNQALK